MIWDDEYKTGIKEIDNQHLQWVLIVKKLMNALLTDFNKESTISILNNSIQYAEKHFEYEENLMKINNYPYLKKHKKLHKNMTAYVKKILLEIDTNYSRSHITQMSNTFLEWLLEHIEKEDKKFIPYIKQNSTDSKTEIINKTPNFLIRWFK